jgi:hypothetical protein
LSVTTPFVGVVALGLSEIVGNVLEWLVPMCLLPGWVQVVLYEWYFVVCTDPVVWGKVFVAVVCVPRILCSWLDVVHCS